MAKKIKTPSNGKSAATKDAPQSKEQGTALPSSSGGSFGSMMKRGKIVAPNLPLLALAIVGILLTAYLTLNVWISAVPAFCSEDSGCDIVQSSRWGKLLGVPVSFWGFLAYATLAIIAWRIRSVEWHWKLSWSLAVLSLGFSIYLTVISFVVIKASCPYCLGSLGLFTLIAALLTWQHPPKGIEGFRWVPWLASNAGVLIVFLVTLHLNYQGYFNTGDGPEKPHLTSLATHLKAEGAVFYGAYWCAACMEQKKLFSNSVKHLPYVECSPNGQQSARSAECIDKNVVSYPTWFINNTRYLGVRSLQDLARLSNYKGIPIPN